MNRYAFLLFLSLSLSLVSCNSDKKKTSSIVQKSTLQKQKIASSGTWDFEDVPLGKLPQGWQTDNKDLWHVGKDQTAPSGGQVLTMTDAEQSFELFGGGFNLTWADTNTISFLDGEITVKFKALSGEIDQGGGIVWRVQDSENYYVARFNPLEDNFRIYTVKKGSRSQLLSATIKLQNGEWHEMLIRQHANNFEGYLDGKQILQGDDDTFTDAGGVGLWTKADAVTSFDDFTVQDLIKKE